MSGEQAAVAEAIDRATILLAAIDAAGIPNDTALLDIREENGYLNVFCPADLRALLDAALATATPARLSDNEFEAGVRQAMTWLRADYPYGEGPDWRENGCEWIADRLAEHTAARAVQPTPPAQAEAVAAMCSQCEELPAVMVKVGTDDGWCTDCLDMAAATPEAAVKALFWAADEMEAVIADGDIAEVAAPVPGEVGRAACVERRDRLYEEPATWLREYAAALAPTAADQVAEDLDSHDDPPRRPLGPPHDG